LVHAKWSKSDYVKRAGSIDANLEFLKRFTKNMADAGVLLITGTDAPGIPGLMPGYSLHDDMDTLEAAGLSRYEILAAATRTPGELIRRSLPAAMPSALSPSAIVLTSCFLLPTRWRTFRRCVSRRV
jgi:hypothetical protein